MPYRRTTKERAEARKVARKLYVKDRLSLKEVRQQTGENMRTLKAWCDLGDWDGLREKEAKTELDRLESIRENLLDRAEAQIKEDKLPHIEIGLMYRMEKLIAQQKKEENMVKIIALNTVRHFVEYLIKKDQGLALDLVPYFEEWNTWVGNKDFGLSAQDFRRPRKLEIPTV